MTRDFRTLLEDHQVDSRLVLVLRHTPQQRRLREMLPSLAANAPEAFNAYQQTQPEHVEKRMAKAAYIASFVGHKPGLALFIGVYERHGEQVRAPEDIRSETGVQILERYGLPAETRPRLWFDLRLRDDFCPELKGRLEIRWPGIEKNWHRFADRADFETSTVHGYNQLITPVMRSAGAP